MIGQTISHYKILEKLGEGGMGVVYKALDTKLDRHVALKFLPSQVSANEETKARFLQEARAAAALNHPNIAQIYSIEESGDTMFITMEFVDGKTLNQLETGNLNPEVVLRHASHIAAALQAAHSKGIIHRDIKSANIMVTGEGTVKIMDFGLAKMMTGPQVTKIGTTVGTAAYMSPEQVQGKEADRRSDIWSFGAVLYEMVSGQLPFGGTYEQAVFYSILNQPPLPIPESRPGTTSLSRVLNKCLEKDPSRRYQSFSEVLTDLDAPTSVKSHASGATWRQPQASRKAFAAMASLLLIVLAVLVIGPEKIQRWAGFDDIPDEQHLAVLPFTSIGGDSTKQPLCDGLVETITSKLTQLEQFHGSLWVVPSSEVRRNRTQSPGEAYQSFGANLVITGNLQLVEDVFRLTLNLIDARNLRQLSSSVLDVRQAGIAGLQDQSITRLLEMLNLELSPSSQDVIAAGATTVAAANEEYLQGLGYLQRYDVASNLDIAIIHFQRSVEHDSTFALAHAGLGEAYWRKYETSKNPALVKPALENCERAYRLNPKLPEVSIALGLIHWGTGENEKALQDFRTALELTPRSDAAYRGLARVYEASGDLTEAEATYKRAIQLKPTYWASYNELGVFYYRKGRYQEAAEQFLQVTRLTPDNVRAYSNAGGVYYMLKRWPEARQMFERSIAIKKTHAACSNLATLYYVQGRFAEAATMYEEALRLNDQDYRVWGNLGAACYWAPGAREKATPAFLKAIQGAKEALKVNPKDAETISSLSGYYAMIGERNNALTLIDQALRIDPTNATVLYTVGTTHEQLGNREKALLWIGRAIEKGYSLHEVEQQPELRQLVADPRYAELKKKAHQE